MGNQHLSKRLSALAPSQTLVMAAKARELENKGIQVIKLNLGEPDFLTPKHITEAGKKAIDEGYFSYSPVPGYLPLRQAIVNKLKRDNGLDYTPENIVCSTGAKHSLANVFYSIVDPGDEVIIFSPYWVSYLGQTTLVEGKPVIVKGAIENDFKVNAEQLEKAITPKTKVVIYSSPCNPTGSLYNRAELEALAKVIEKYPNIYVISDEIYEYINFYGKHESIAQFENIKDRVIVVNGLSKGFAMTGWRLGYIAAATWIAKACIKFQGQFTSGTSSITQRAAITALSDDLDACHDMRDAFKKRRDLVLSLIRKIKGVKTNVPQGAFYLFPDVSYFFGKSYQNQTIENSYDLCMYLLNEAHVSLVDGGAFGEPKCMRISFAASEDDLKTAMDRIEKALNRLT